MGDNKNKNEDLPLATQIIHTMKMIIYFLLLLEVATITGFLIYLSMPSEEAVIESDEGTANYIGNGVNGVITNGNYTGE